MAKSQKMQKKPAEKPAQLFQPKDFLDRIAPAAVKFNTDSYVLGGLYRCVLALRGYPAVTEELALLAHVCNRAGIALHLYTRQVTAAEEEAIYHKAVNKLRLDRSNQDNLKRSVTAEANLQDVAAIIAAARQNREPLIHCAVFLELAAKSPEELRRLRDEVGAELTRAKLSADPLLLRQREGFLSANPVGRNALGARFERVLPASSTANLYPINYSGRSDPHGFYIGNDHYGSDVLLDLDRRTPDKTNSSVLILGNSGEGKSYLLKLLLCNLLESGKTVICLDPEQELTRLCDKLDGCYGGGTNSTAMLIGLWQRRIPVDLILFADPGGEQPHTYSYLEIMSRWLAEHGMPPITRVWYTTRDGQRLTLEQECLRSGSLPSIAYGHKKCSLKHKAFPQEKFCRHDPRCRAVWAGGGRVIKFIGYDAGEPERRERVRERDEADSKYQKEYPLMERGWARDRCIQAIREAGLPLPGKSSCFFCPSMKRREIRTLYHKYPELLGRALAIEDRARPNLVTVKGLGRNWAWRDFLEYDKGQLAFPQVFPEDNLPCSCGGYIT